MSPVPAAYRFGDIVKANVPEPTGAQIDYEHTAMVLRPPDANGDLWLLVISSKFTRPVGRFMFEVPWKEGGHPDTGLWRECVIKCQWAVPFNQRDISARIGRMPSELAEKAVEYAITAAEEKQQQNAARTNL
jgi:mRNA-degrading endonuclease toxin of MazEF toxin-antitoxin module